MHQNGIRFGIFHSRIQQLRAEEEGRHSDGFSKDRVDIYNHDCPNGIHIEFIETISQISSYIYSPSLPRLGYTLISNRHSYEDF